MDAEISLPKKRKPQDFMALLSSAACEWFLIFLLFVDAAFSYLLTKFANYCELKTPCLLCSRPDLVIRDKKPRCYRSVLCSDHIEEISSLVSCSVHNKLADVNGMCEECLMPIAMKNKSNSESYRLLVGKLLVDVERSVLQNLMLNKNIRLVSSGQRTCSCCNKTWKPKSNAERLHQVTSVGIGASKANVKPPLPRVPGRSRFSRRDSFKRLRDKCAGQVKNQPAGSKSVDSLSHVGYTKLNITSDSDSEAPLSDDDDDGNSGFCGRNDNTENSVPKTLTDNACSEKQALQATEPIISLLDQSVLLDLSELNNKKSVTSDELKWAQSHSKPNLSEMAELISLSDGFQPLALGVVPFDASVETNKCNVSLSHMPTLSVLSELLSLNNVPSSANIGIDQPKPAYVMGTGYEENASVAGHIAAETGNSSEHVYVPASNDMNLTDASSPNNEGTEPIVVSDSNKIEEDTKSLQQVSNSEMGLMSKTMSPKAHSQLDALSKHEDSSPRALPVSSSLERHDSGHESFDGISISEIEGESVVDRLKRQVEYDRSCMSALYKELEEERNAAAVAANQAMAMITRLQEEKAALHMEALQYLRMMEEQAEHDMEALEKANELLAEKEKEVQDLEAELEFCISNFLDESMAKDTLKETCNLEKENLIVENHAENSPAATSDSKSTEILKGSGKSKLVNISILNFEDEKLYISECLKLLEEKLHQAASNGISNDMPNGINSRKITNEVDDLEYLSVDWETRLNEQNENNGSPLQKDVSGSNGSPTQDIPTDLVEDNHFVSEKNATLDSDRCKLSTNRGRMNWGTFEKGIADLRDRLEALETDRDFVKHAFNTLRNGKDGLQFIHEIAHQLQELRKIEFKKRCIRIP
ncbi:putative myosin-binding protein 4 [Forsythia ovata]|uniref:Myosin-binding protein 4 n=1 Tax=Forsythia ovata TaxID=205694 RepID=A0ABD1X8K5_9LAMI